MVTYLAANDAAGRTVRTPAAAEICGMKWWTMLRWVRAGKVRPALERGRSYGSSEAIYGWSLHQVIALRVGVELRKRGVRKKAQEAAVRAILAYRGDLHAALIVVLPEHRCHVLRADDADGLASLLLRSGRIVGVYRIDAWAESAEKRFLDQLGAPAEETA